MTLPHETKVAARQPGDAALGGHHGTAISLHT